MPLHMRAAPDAPAEHMPMPQQAPAARSVRTMVRGALCATLAGIACSTGSVIYKIYYAPVHQRVPADCDASASPPPFEALRDGNIFNVPFTVTDDNMEAVTAQFHESERGLALSVNKHVLWPKATLPVRDGEKGPNGFVSRIEKRGDAIILISDRLDATSCAIPARSICDIARALREQTGEQCTVSFPYRLDRKGWLELVRGVHDEGTHALTWDVERAPEKKLSLASTIQ